MAIIEYLSNLIVDSLSVLYQVLRFSERELTDLGISSSIVWFFLAVFAVRLSIITGLRLGLGRWARRPTGKQHS